MNSVRIYVLAAPLLIGCSLVATAATADTKPIVNLRREHEGVHAAFSVVITRLEQDCRFARVHR